LHLDQSPVKAMNGKAVVHLSRLTTTFFVFFIGATRTAIVTP
jgi:hypothetical protein